MNTANNFKILQEEDERLYPPPPEIEESVLGSLRILSIMGEAMELYIPKIFEMFILSLGGTIREIDQAARDDQPDGDPAYDSDGLLPGIAGSPLGDDDFQIA